VRELRGGVVNYALEKIKNRGPLMKTVSFRYEEGFVGGKEEGFS